MNCLALTIWIATLAVVVLAMVPVAVALLSRTLRNARSIERYLADMLEAGEKIVGHTEAITSLENTRTTAGAMAAVATSIGKRTETVAGILAARAQGDAG